MLVQELLPLLDATLRVVDTTTNGADVRRYLRIPDGLEYTTADPTSEPMPEVGPGTVLIAMIGPKPGQHTDPTALAGMLRGIQPGGRALLLLAYAIDEVPQHQLLGPLVDAGCQILRALPLDQVAAHGAHCALIVECVDKLAPPTAYLTDIRPELPGAGTADPGADEQRTMLRLANEYVLGDFMTRPLRRRVAELEQRVAKLDQLLTERQAQLDESARALAKARNRVARMESSISFQVGRMMVDGVRHPARALVSAPRDLARVVRAGRWRRKQRSGRLNMPPVQVVPAVPRPDRVVPVVLPRPNATAESPLLTVKAPPRLLVPRRLATGGLAEYEPESLACFLATIDVAGPGAVLDVGANTGLYAVLASALTPREVVAFEPTPELVEVARRTAIDNGLGYTVETIALGAANGKATFHLSTSSDTSNSLAEGFRESEVQIEVEVETLDSYTARTGVVPAVLKVDTETTEPDVLAGGAGTITRHRPWILCEVLAGRVEDRLAEVLKPWGYHWYHVTDTTPPYQKADTIVGDRTYQALMWLFAPQEPSPAFWAALKRHRAAIAECTAERGRDLADRQARLSA